MRWLIKPVTLKALRMLDLTLMRITAGVRLVRNTERIPSRDPIAAVPTTSRIPNGTMTKMENLMVTENRIRNTTLSAAWATLSTGADTNNKA